LERRFGTLGPIELSNCYFVQSRRGPLLGW
jgi:hypothetical protein